MREGTVPDQQAALAERRAARRRQIRRRRAVALGGVTVIIAVAAVGAAFALEGGSGKQSSVVQRIERSQSTPTKRAASRTKARVNGSLGDAGTKRACTLLTRGEIRAQLGGPVAKPIAMWPFCRWQIGGDSFVALQYQPGTPVEAKRRRSYVLESTPGLAQDAFFGSNRGLYFGDERASYFLLFQRTSEFTGIRREQLIALARKALARGSAAGTASAGTETPRAGGPLRVFFGGDSLAAGPSWAFVDGVKGRAGMQARAEYQVGTGLLRGDYFDWVRHLRAVVAATDPRVVVFMAGANDSQDATVRGRYYPVGTPTWRRVYRSRVSAAMEAAGAGGRKVIWVGMPPMRDATLSNGMAEVDAVFSSQAKKRPNVTYVDTWALFSGPGGGYTDALPNTSGELETIRLEDGIHLNVAGSQRLARAVTRAVDRAARA